METVRILLVYSSEIQSRALTDLLRVPPIGLFFINGSLLEKGYKTRIMHIMPAHFGEPSPESDAYKEKLHNEIKEFNPHYIGYSFRNLLYWGGLPKDPRHLVNFFSVSLEKPIIDFLRKITSSMIIGGGSGFSLAPKLYMKYMRLDFGIVGEGELAFSELINNFATGEDISGISGLVYPRDGSFVINPRSRIEDLDALPSMEIGDFTDFVNLYCRAAGYANVQTKRGCSFKCIYCQYPYLEGSRYRLRSPSQVVDEVISIKEKYDIRRFFIVDSVFSTPVEHSVELCRMLIDRKVDIEWTAYVNPRGLTKDVLKIYKESGCHYLTLTADSLSAKVLDSYQKDFSIDDVRNCVELLKEISIPFEVSLILGGIGEDEESVKESVAFCDKYLKNVPVSFLAGMWVHPSAPAIETLIEEGILSGDDPVDYDKIIESNDFETNSKLKYFFPNVKRYRKEFLNRIFTMIRKDKREVVGVTFGEGGRVL